MVKFDVPLLGDISGLNCIHLQCHIGTDTLSLARLGAGSVTGLDFSETSVAAARSLAARTPDSGGDKVAFVQADVYSAVDVVPPASYDLVFTGIGALPWLPSISRWAETVAALLKPGGRLFIREGHPILGALENNDRDKLSLEYSYFERPEPDICPFEGTYVDSAKGTKFKADVTGQFGHGMGEIIQALLDHGMRITGMKEHDTVPWQALQGHMRLRGNGEWEIIDRPERVPLSFTLQAVKDA